MDEALKKRIVAAAREFEVEGFMIVGAFGSRARGDHDADSDLDLLYRLEDRFLERYPGWVAYVRIEAIKGSLTCSLGIPIDVADIEALDDIGRESILPEIVYIA